MTDPIESADKVLGVTKAVFDLAKESPELSEAGKKMAGSALTIAKAIDNVLLPIAAINYAFDSGRRYFEDRFKKDVEVATSSIPKGEVVEPKASIAAPIIEGLTFSHEEQELKKLFLGLLGSSMDARVADRVHPAFVGVIRQLTAREAELLSFVLSVPAIAACRLSEVVSKGGFRVRYGVLLGIERKGQPLALDGVEVMVQNWVRLGLVELTFLEYFSDEAPYEFVKRRGEYLELAAELGADKIRVENGLLRPTPFGREFFKVVIDR